MGLYSWVTSSFVRHFPLTLVQSAQPLAVHAALNERFSFQVALHATGGEKPLSVQVKVSGPKGWEFRVRRIGYVPVRHRNTPVEAGSLDADGAGFIPGFVPDPLFDQNTMLLARNETHAFWISVRPGQDAHPGQYQIRVSVSGETSEEAKHSVYGDSFLVYPGEHGPVDSVRWEVIAEALQDYALLQTLDVDRNCELLQPIKGFEEFPKMEAWRLDARAQLLTQAAC